MRAHQRLTPNTVGRVFGSFAPLQCYLPTSFHSAKIFGKAIQPQRRDARKEKPHCAKLCVHRVSAVHAGPQFGCGFAALCLCVKNLLPCSSEEKAQRLFAGSVMLVIFRAKLFELPAEISLFMAQLPQ